MIPIIEDAVLGNDLDGQFYSLLNVKALDPVPPNLVTVDDPRLTDLREPALGSVTNVSVAADAAIDQSKLALNGQIPTAWLGTTLGTAADGSLAEYVANKDQPNGYAGLDSAGKIPSSRLPDAVGLATVTSVGLVMPAEFIVGGSPITTSGTFTVSWANLTGAAWFGRLSGTGVPSFQTGPLPVSLVPDLPAEQITSGTFDYHRLPPLIGVGSGHAPGMVPDPSDGLSGQLATDYLGRDALWHTAPTIAVSYQPQLPSPTITPSGDPPASRTVAVGYDPNDVAIPDEVRDALFFYAITATATVPTSGFAELPAVGYIAVPATKFIHVYAAHSGFNNSPITHYENV